MDTERFGKIRKLFEAARDHPLDFRDAFLQKECGGDMDLLTEVRNLLSADGESLGWIDEGMVGLPPSVDSGIPSADIRPPQMAFVAWSAGGVGSMLPTPMTLTGGTRVGPYDIVALIGAGGMGEVYRARDVRLHRDVAIKVLPAAFSTDPDRLRRFEQEARSAGMLNHPNILTVHDFGVHDGAPYIVTELLEGATLREHLKKGRLAPRKAVDYALQIARGLAAAHQKRIVHRDLKPENLFVNSDSRVKILDFGLAKLTAAGWNAADSMATGAGTNSGVILGTTGYMSPEQVRGQDADHRSDVFAFGVVLYEMLSGERAFSRDSNVETMNAILKEDPPDLLGVTHEVGPALARLVEHCLEKEPDQRFQSVRDLAFGLETLSELTGSTAAAPAVEPRPSRRRLLIGAGLGLASFATGAFSGLFRDRIIGTAPITNYRKLSFQRGTVWQARFAPEGTNIIYSATWDGNPMEIFSLRIESSEHHPVGLQDTDLLAISSQGDMAILRNRRFLWWYISRGTLARMPLGGGGPRDVIEDVQEADWSPDGADLAVTRYQEAQNLLEYPIGKLLYKTPGYISSPRVSPRGDRVVFLDHQIQGDNRGWVAVVDTEGQRQTLSGEWAFLEGLAWSPDGDEVWFTAARSGESSALYAATLSGTERLIARVPANLVLHDVARDGRALLSRTELPTTIVALPQGETEERDLSWPDFVSVSDLSNDGKTFVFTYSGEGSGADYTVYLRETNGSPAVRLDEGSALALSPDGKWVLTLRLTSKELVLVPTRTGETRRLGRYGLEEVGFPAGWLDGKRILFAGREAGGAMREYVQDIDAGEPRPVTPQGVLGKWISPDGRFVVARDPLRKAAAYPIENGAPRPIQGLEPEDEIIRWADERTLYISQYAQSKFQVYKLDIVTGGRKLFREIRLADPAGAGVINRPQVFLTSNGQGYLFQACRVLSTVYLVEGLP